MKRAIRRSKYLSRAAPGSFCPPQCHISGVIIISAEVIDMILYKLQASIVIIRTNPVMD